MCDAGSTVVSLKYPPPRFHLLLPTSPQFAAKEIFLLEFTSDSPSWTVLQPYVFANPKQLTFKQQGRANSANRTTTLSQQGFLFKADEMLTHQRKTGKIGKVRELMPFFVLMLISSG